MKYLAIILFLSGHIAEAPGPSIADVCRQRAALERTHGVVNWSGTYRIDLRWPQSREPFQWSCK
jgi:hypothetical protein